MEKLTLSKELLKLKQIEKIEKCKKKYKKILYKCDKNEAQQKTRKD